MRLRPPHRPPR